MKSIFAILSFLSFLVMIIGLIKPVLFQKVFKSQKISRWKIFGIMIIITMIFSGLSEVDFQNNQENQNNKFNLTEQQRKQFYKDVVGVEDKARLEADSLIPYTVDNVSVNKEKYNELREKYIVSVLEKYKVNKSQEKEITDEGLKNSWPLE